MSFSINDGYSNSLSSVAKVNMHRSLMVTAILSALIAANFAAVTSRNDSGQDRKSYFAPAVTPNITTAPTNFHLNGEESQLNGTSETSAHNKNATLEVEENEVDGRDENPDYNSTPTAADMNGTTEENENNDDEQIYGENENYLDNYDDNGNGEDDENPELEDEDEDEEGGAGAGIYNP